MGILRDAVRAWAAEGFKDPEFQDDPSGLRSSFGFPLKDEQLELSLFVDSDDEASCLSVFAYLHLEVPEARRAEVAALLAQVNGGYRVGSLELIDSGKVRFRAGFNLEDTPPSVKAIDNVIRAAVATCSEVMPALVAVVTGGMGARAAVEAVLGGAANAEGATTEPTAAAAWLDERVARRDWGSFRGVAPIQTWASRLRSQPAGDELAARAVLFVGPDIDACQSVARRAAEEAGYRFAFVPRAEVDAQSPATLANLKALAPVMVFLQAGRWSLSPDHPNLDKDAEDRARAFQTMLLGVIAAQDPAKPVLFATSTGAFRHLGDALTNVGAFDLAFAVPEPAPRAQGEAFLDAVGRPLCGPTLTEHPAKLGKALALVYGTSAGRDLARLHLRRLAAREGRKVEFLDLVEIYTRGFVEAAPLDDAPAPMREHVAVHEAGHAAMAVLDSGGLDVPDFSTILPSGESRGVVVSSLSHRHDAGERMTYEDFRHSVRVSLAGRAAEELVYGPTQVANGASSDLENATRLSYRGFAEWGFAPAMETLEASRSNLAVLFDTPAEPEVAHTMVLVRRFLAEEYTRVLDALRQHRAFLEAVRDRLLVDPVVDRSELAELCERHGVSVQATE